MISFRAFYYGCWFSHSKETHWTGNVLTCQRCWEPIPILVKKIPKGDAAIPDPVRGSVVTKAKKVRSNNVREFTRESQR